ncbi:hypothetical protein T552_01853 [Pneumocystis carinii B80]|uniref:Glutamate-rich WD repeat-containing protein 1 n=1 Tax=Pneumocystis carinii (strain B80) TaxID=1408658 RepID=A0A0W4ZHZ7_PNEC8|nr:hypothetical protein T552_01853 [Pneumocystis carinii B80]KTW27989.1 hypothetical protein T552_01853 [Pneumocystis carinii B80]
MHKRQKLESSKENTHFQNIIKSSVIEKNEDNIGEFEDPWEDEIESEEYIEEDINEDPINEKVKVYLPSSRSLKEDEILEPDQSAYEMLHSINVQWPYLSFDILKDNSGLMTNYPVTVYLVSGTQADIKKDNNITVMKLSHLCRTQYDDDSINSNDSDIDEDPILEYRSLPTFGTTNRIRAFFKENENYFVASFSETGKVHIWDIAPHLLSINNPGVSVAKKCNSPIYTVLNHKIEGYAIDWNILSSHNSLISGDNNGFIYLTSLSEASWFTEKTPFLGHISSVEDLAWSPSEKNVFASASTDGTVKIWDIRNKKHKPALSTDLHPGVDINVISWNKNVSYLMATGADDGKFNIWDLRTFQSSSIPSFIASFSWHTAPITSIEWHPSEKSVISVSDKNHVSLWDLSVEVDNECQTLKEADDLDHIPNQLMFIHMGGKDIKEAHWHHQIPGCVVSTSSTGIQVFKTISI